MSCFLSCITWAIKPSGYFLVLKIQVGYDSDNASMFEVGFDGSIKQWWNQSVGSLSGSGAFAFDNESKTVYLPTVNQSTAVSRNGKVVIQKLSSNQVFWSYNYEAHSDHLVGVCSDSNREQWRWCEIDIQTGRLSLNPNRLPYIDGPNGLDAYEPLCTFDFRQQLIWYKPYIQPFLVAANYRPPQWLIGASNEYHYRQNLHLHVIGHFCAHLYRKIVFNHGFLSYHSPF